MKQLTRKVLMLAAVLVCVFGFAATAHAKASYKTIVSYGQKNKYSFKADMTGNGKQNSFVVSIGNTTRSYKRKVIVNMDGKDVLRMNADQFYGIQIQYVNLSRKAQFLYLNGYGDSRMPSIQGVYQYNKSKKKLVKVLNLMDKYLGTATGVTGVTGNSITFRNNCGPSLTGRITWKFTFRYANGKFSLKSSTAGVKYASSYKANDGYDKYFAKSKYVASTSFNTYSDLAGTKTAYSVKRGDVLSMKKVRLYEGCLYFLFTNSAGQKGWIKGTGANAKSYLFYGLSNRLAGGFYG